jgi:hypothetical protein
MPNKPTVLSQGMVDHAVGDNAFFGQMPEFAQLRSTLSPSVRIPAGGCSGCGRTKQKTNLFKNFVLVASSLTLEGGNRLKRYFGVSGLMLNVLDPASKQVTLKIL